VRHRRGTVKPASWSSDEFDLRVRCRPHVTKELLADRIEHRLADYASVLCARGSGMRVVSMA
jgi:hypothetical protein